MVDFDFREMDDVPPATPSTLTATIFEKIRNWWDEILDIAATEGRH